MKLSSVASLFLLTNFKQKEYAHKKLKSCLFLWFIHNIITQCLVKL